MISSEKESRQGYCVTGVLQYQQNSGDPQLLGCDLLRTITYSELPQKTVSQQVYDYNLYILIYLLLFFKEL